MKFVAPLLLALFTVVAHGDDIVGRIQVVDCTIPEYKGDCLVVISDPNDNTTELSAAKSFEADLKQARTSGTQTTVSFNPETKKISGFIAPQGKAACAESQDWNGQTCVARRVKLAPCAQYELNSPQYNQCAFMACAMLGYGSPAGFMCLRSQGFPAFPYYGYPYFYGFPRYQY